MSHADIKNKVRAWTPEYALSLLERAVEEKGVDYQDPGAIAGGCRYFDPKTKQPSCIVGHALAYDGVTLDDFIEVPSDVDDGEDPSPYLDQEFGVSVLTGVDTPTWAVLSTAQRKQDSGYKWGVALAEAKGTLAREQVSV